MKVYVAVEKVPIDDTFQYEKFVRGVFMDKEQASKVEPDFKVLGEIEVKEFQLIERVVEYNDTVWRQV